MTSTELAREVVSALVESGVREVVVAPGSRNAPLSFAVYDAAAAGLGKPVNQRLSAVESCVLKRASRSAAPAT